MNDKEIYLDDDDEIIGRMPKWIIFRGSSLLLILIICILVGAYFFKYPTYVQVAVLIKPGDKAAFSASKSIKNNNIEVIGNVLITEAGKIKMGQKISISLKAFQSNTFGKLRGEVVGLCPINSSTDATLNIKLINGLKTDKGYTIDLQPKLYGSGEILVERVPLLYRLIPFLDR